MPRSGHSTVGNKYDDDDADDADDDDDDVVASESLLSCISLFCGI